MALQQRLLVLCVLVVVTTVSGFYVPGVGPRDFEPGGLVDITAVKLTSVKAQLPYDFYSLPFCRPEKVEYKTENLGGVLRGDRIVNTMYQVNMATSQACRVLCSTINFDEKELKLVRKRIKQEYSIHLLADNLPGATKFLVGGQVQYEHGYKLGYIQDEKVYLNNHLKLTLHYNSEWNNSVCRIVAFELVARSIKPDKLGAKTGETCNINDKTVPLELPKTGNATSVTFTYEVEFRWSEIHWASRWDTYLRMADQPDLNIHWFSIVNSIIVVFFLAGILTMIIVRTLRRDIAKYNKLEDEVLYETV